MAALALDHESMQEIARVGITPRTDAADFDPDVRTAVFHGSAHARAEWPREMEFAIDEGLEQPFKLEMITLSGRFQPLHAAQVKLDGPPSGSVLLTIRGTLKQESGETAEPVSSG